MYRVVLRIEQVPPDVGPEAAKDITDGFTQRPWHRKAICLYEDGGLTFTSENDFDDNGLATLDELSDEYTANVVRYEDCGGLSIISVQSF